MKKRRLWLIALCLIVVIGAGTILLYKNTSCKDCKYGTQYIDANGGFECSRPIKLEIKEYFGTPTPDGSNKHRSYVPVDLAEAAKYCKMNIVF